MSINLSLSLSLSRSLARSLAPPKAWPIPLSSTCNPQATQLAIHRQLVISILTSSLTFSPLSRGPEHQTLLPTPIILNPDPRTYPFSRPFGARRFSPVWGLPSAVKKTNTRHTPLYGQLVRDGQTSPHRPRLVVSRSTCPPPSRGLSKTVDESLSSLLGTVFFAYTPATKLKTFC